MKKDQKVQLDFIIKSNIKKRKEIADYNKFLRLFKEKEIEKRFLVGSSLIMFLIKTLEELKIIRNILRREFEIWEDELSSVQCWYNEIKEDYEITFCWIGKFLPIRIQLECYQKDMPEELKNLKPGCKFKETIAKMKAYESRNLSYVCDTK